jgi:hypothetical protein
MIQPTGFAHQHVVISVPPKDDHDAPQLLQVAPQVIPLQQIDPLNLWKMVPPTCKYMDVSAKHPTDSDSYNSADESESSLSSGFVSDHDDGIPDAHVDWVKNMCPITARALARAKVGKTKRSKKQ